MVSRSKQLPPLSYLAAFEAAARHENFTAAAEELCLTQSAVSRQIRLLEETLRCPLFVRSHKAVTLTEGGRKFQRTVNAALELLASAAYELRVQASSSTVTVSTDLAFASHWLIPRLPQFREAHPEIVIHVDASDEDTTHIREGADVAIQFGDGHWPACSSRFLLDEEICPVCSPAYLARQTSMRGPEDLLNCTLIHLETRHWDWMDWPTWFARNDLALGEPRQDLYINNYPAVLQAALGGQGVAMGWRYLADDMLDAGVLVRPIETSVRTGRGFFLLYPADSLLSPEARIFCDWIVRMCAK
ncbi:transcriptional regulator GcvA [Burkholderia sp. Ac-20379]|uniref:transcriptional regulator GcvA n=1 Tax=Burkholderia sp. Ac-20379 TaxID=2703900 RepID=UPI00197ED797|nr:transcriptional regulator GcvA [Burkholderia sp. Ac-20379]MBN3723273.1 transcriptional regulator GcvA [Burkholderia sp. Ac-20379]